MQAPQLNPGSFELAVLFEIFAVAPPGQASAPSAP